MTPILKDHLKALFACATTTVFYLIHPAVGALMTYFMVVGYIWTNKPKPELKE